jgi:hypothetical protein
MATIPRSLALSGNELQKAVALLYLIRGRASHLHSQSETGNELNIPSSEFPHDDYKKAITKFLEIYEKS